MYIHICIYRLVYSGQNMLYSMCTAKTYQKFDVLLPGIYEYVYTIYIYIYIYVIYQYTHTVI